MPNWMTICDGCGREETIGEEGNLHLPLYVRGSEGVYLCLTCRVALTNIVRHWFHIIGSVKLQCARDRLSRKSQGERHEKQD